MNMHGNLLNYADRKDVDIYANSALPSLFLWKPENSKAKGDKDRMRQSEVSSRHGENR